FMFFSKRAFNILNSTSRCSGASCLFVSAPFISISFLLRCHVTQGCRKKSSKNMAFPQPKSRKDNDRKGDKPNHGGVVWKLLKRTVYVTDYRNAEHDVNPAKN